MNEKAVAERIAQDVLTARERKAGGTIFTVKSPLDNYQKYVERMMPRWFAQTDMTGIFVKGSVRWKGPAVESHMMAVSEYFNFQQSFEGEVLKEEGKITARIQGGDIYIAVMIYE